MPEPKIEYELGSGAAIVNETEFPDNVVYAAMQDQLPEIAAQVNKFVGSWQGTLSRRRNSSVFNQDMYSIPESIFDQFKVAANAARYDDTVSNAVELTEQLAFKRVMIECGDDDANNVINQALDKVDLPQRMREIWRELFVVSQCYVAVQWGRRSFKVKGQGDTSGRKRKKSYNLLVPTGISTLDPCKVLPVGNFLFGNERLAYIAEDEQEAKQIENSLAGKNTSDLIVTSLFKERYQPTPEELSEITDLVGRDFGVENRLFYLNPDNVWRITASRPSYQRFADVRMASVFELLDIKHNLRESDRSDILGNLNCIVLVTKGDKDIPATQEELEGVNRQMRQSARNSLMISDHRIDIKIITKKTDWTLQPERHNALDSRITSRLFQILSTGNYSSGAALDDSTKLFKVIAASMEARRDIIRDSISDHLVEKIWEKNSELKGDPAIQFYPRRIALDFDPKFTQIIFDLFQTGDLSRETMLSELDIDQEQEAIRKKAEDDKWGDIFNPKDPGDAAPGASPGQQGRIAGGNKNGGGANQNSFNANPNNPDPDAEPDDDKS